MKQKKRAKNKRQPLRTCLGCSKVVAKRDCFRFVLREVKLVVDPQALLDGRGVYCCKSRECLRQMLRKKKRLISSFRSIIHENEIETSCMEVVNRLLG